MKSLTRVALVFPEAHGYAEGVLRGIAAYARPDKPWLFRHIRPEPREIGPLAAWKPSGAIVYLESPAVARAVKRLGCPAVNAAVPDVAPDMPHVGNDDWAIGRTAAEYFLGRGFRSFAYAAYRPDTPWSGRRGRAFARALSEAGFRCRTCRPRGNDADVYRWIRSLVKPVAMLAANAERGWEIAELCLAGGFRVPEEVALLGVDDDQTICQLAWPPLSSIAVAEERIGHEAAAMLDRLMARGPARSRTWLSLPPLGVVTRQSSDIYAVDDPDVVAALRYISDNSHRPLPVDDVVRALPVARRTLEKSFRRMLGRSVLQEVHRVRLERAKHLLAATDCSVAEIAARTGFSEPKRLTLAFRGQLGTTPTLYRHQFRHGTMAPHGVQA